MDTGLSVGVALSTSAAPDFLQSRRGPSAVSRHRAEQGDRRRARRYAIDAAIKVNDETALTINLSRSGVFFESERPFRVGDPVSLILPYEHTRPGASVACTARVRRIEPRGEFYGVAAMIEMMSCTIPA
jgi:hypothetical protein